MRKSAKSDWNSTFSPINWIQTVYCGPDWLITTRREEPDWKTTSVPAANRPESTFLCLKSAEINWSIAGDPIGIATQKTRNPSARPCPAWIAISRFWSNSFQSKWTRWLAPSPMSARPSSRQIPILHRRSFFMDFHGVVSLQLLQMSHLVHFHWLPSTWSMVQQLCGNQNCNCLIFQQFLNFWFRVKGGF